MMVGRRVYVLYSTFCFYLAHPQVKADSDGREALSLTHTAAGGAA